MDVAAQLLASILDTVAFIVPIALVAPLMKATSGLSGKISNMAAGGVTKGHAVGKESYRGTNFAKARAAQKAANRASGKTVGGRLGRPFRGVGNVLTGGKYGAIQAAGTREEFDNEVKGHGLRLAQAQMKNPDAWQNALNSNNEAERVAALNHFSDISDTKTIAQAMSNEKFGGKKATANSRNALIDAVVKNKDKAPHLAHAEAIKAINDGRGDEAMNAGQTGLVNDIANGKIGPEALKNMSADSAEALGTHIRANHDANRDTKLKNVYGGLTEADRSSIGGHRLEQIFGSAGANVTAGATRAGSDTGRIHNVDQSQHEAEAENILRGMSDDELDTHYADLGQRVADGTANESEHAQYQRAKNEYNRRTGQQRP
jgi:hypothetical protein